MTAKSYQQTLDYLYSRLPMFTRDGASAFKKDLGNTIEFCKLLGDPQTKFRSVHIGGTNGKGSSSHMLAAILQTAGYKTGLYTSPHLKDFRERIRINGEMITEDEVISFVAENKNHIERIEPSFFEVTVAMAFDHFAKHKVDIAIIEVGLGGRLDSTNIITPILSVITNISFDHMNMLGNTLKEIATEKAGIIKKNIPVVIGERSPETDPVFIEKAEKENSSIIFAQDEWIVKRKADSETQRALEIQVKPSTFQLLTKNLQPPTLNLSLDLTGSYQLKNIRTVMSAVDELRKQTINISDDDICSALSKVQQLTGLQGRWQILHQEPLIICDTGHNEDGVKEVIRNIQNTPFDKLHMVIGMVKDKDISKILSLLPKNAVYYFCQPDLPRAKPATELAAEARQFGLKGSYFETVSEALIAAKRNAAKTDMIFIGGSTFVVAEVV